jgi:aconitase A
VVFTRGGQAYPDTLVGTDSHTTMINGLGVLGWGVGGIEAEAAMLGQPVSMLIPKVVGFKLTGELPAGATATDLVLTVTELLRKQGVVGKFVEFYGPGVSNVPLADRATIGNMSPEYGSTCAIFPVDEETLTYLRLTGRPAETVALVEAYAKAQGLWHDPAAEPRYSERVELDLSTIVPSLAGPEAPAGPGAADRRQGDVPHRAGRLRLDHPGRAGPQAGVPAGRHGRRRGTGIDEASQAYQAEGTPLVILAGKEYGSGSSRDWAAKGTALLGVRAVIAESYERIHRSNLIGMGVLPLQYAAGENAESLGLTGAETFTIEGIAGGGSVPRELTVRADETTFTVTVRIDTPGEQSYYQHGGIMPFVLRSLL